MTPLLNGTINNYAIGIFYQPLLPVGCFSTEYAQSGLNNLKLK